MSTELGKSSEIEAIFLLPREEGGYRPLRGKMHYDNGRLESLSVKGQRWVPPGPTVPGLTVFHVASSAWLEGQRLLARPVKVSFVNGLFLTQEYLAEAELEQNWSELWRGVGSGQ